jgi:hypothetical protein
VSRKRADAEFVPKVIEADWGNGPDFFAFVPSQIEPQDGYDSRLIGFPLNVVFSGPIDGGQQSPVEVCYVPVPETFRENSERKEMFYVTRPKNCYSIRVIFEKATGQWRTEKFKGKKLIQTAFGKTLDQAMLHTTMGGLEPGER